jgi:hypothetical protein
VLGAAGVLGASIAAAFGGCGDGPDVVCTLTVEQCACLPLPTVRGASPADACDEADGGAICCADSTYPRKGGCACTRVRCVETGAGSCACAPSDDEDAGAVACAASDAPCCAHVDGTCACGPSLRTCPDGGAAVDACSVAALACPVGDRVETCSNP